MRGFQLAPSAPRERAAFALNKQFSASEPLVTPEEQYSTRGSPLDSCWRVLCWNAVTGNEECKQLTLKKRRGSLLGPTGHFERASAYVHLVSAVAFALYAALRPAFGLSGNSIASRLHVATIALNAAVFAVSTAYHTVGTNPVYNPVLRVADHFVIYVSLALASNADLAIATVNFRDIAWQASWDSVVAALALVAFFGYRRAAMDVSETRERSGDCSLGLFREQHSDGDCSACRSASYVALALSFVLPLPNYFQNLEEDVASFATAAATIGFCMLWFGCFLDTILLFPDAAIERSKKQNAPPWEKNLARACSSSRCGCIANSHTWFHVLATGSVVLITSAREFALARAPGLA